MENFVELDENTLSNLPFEDLAKYLSNLSEYKRKKELEIWLSLDYSKKVEVEREKNLRISEYQGDGRSPSLADLLINKLNKLSINEIVYNFGNNSVAHEIVQKLRSYQISSEKFHYFWLTKSVFSQWYLCEFEATTYWFYNEKSNYERRIAILNNIFPIDKQKYSSTEQFMMYHKAMIFGDIEIAQKIMQTNDVREIKNLGREVKHFESTVWDYFKAEIVYEGNKAKFTQNKTLFEQLSATEGKTLVEAAPNDNIWGIGLAEDNSDSLNRENWKGSNLLGEILTLLRIELLGRY